jgi:hypothetical protein
MCTVVVSFEPGERVPVLLLGARDELVDRPWRPPARHWPGSPLIGGIDEQAGGTWLAVHAAVPRVSCLLNGRGAMADPAIRRSRGELPLSAAADGAGVLKDLAGAPGTLAAYDPFHLVCADLAAVWLLSWDGEHAAIAPLPPGTHVLTNAGHAFPAGPGAAVTEPKAAYFGPKFAATRSRADWLALAAGDGLDGADPRAIVARRDLPDGRVWGTTSVSLVALDAADLRYDFQASPGGDTGWDRVVVP